MADDNKSDGKAQQAKATQKMVDDAGKAYDSRLMRRLLTYLQPYKLQVVVSAVATIAKSAADSAGPLLVMVAVDTFMSGDTPPAHAAWVVRHLHLAGVPPMRGVTLIALLYLGACSLPFSWNCSRHTSCNGPARRSCLICGARSSGIFSACLRPSTITIPSAAWLPA